VDWTVQELCGFKERNWLLNGSDSVIIQTCNHILDHQFTCRECSRVLVLVTFQVLWDSNGPMDKYNIMLKSLLTHKQSLHVEAPF